MQIFKLTSFICAATIMAAILGFGCQDSELSDEALSVQESKNSFVFLGDMHFDRPEHHHMNWVAKDFPNDIVQIEDYCRITRDNTPSLMAAVSALNARRPLTCIIQAGDFTEGLCGSYDLQLRQFNDAISFVNGYRGAVPFLITKGNHDITGPGAPQAYNDAILPWLSSQLKQSVTSAAYAVSLGPDRFIFFDAFNPDLDWLEKTLNGSAARYTFFIVHEPVVPFDARSNWHLFVNNPAKRDRLLDLLGIHKAIVLCGHLHKFSILRRNTQNGSFIQIAMNSVISDLNRSPENVLSGVENYSADLVGLEPSFSPSTLDVRKQILENERPWIHSFEYAKTAGFCVINCYTDELVVDLYSGASPIPWKSWRLHP